jgi:hypothetical protein
MKKWGYKERSIFLAILALLLAVSWIFTLIFESGSVSSRAASYVWLPREAKNAADRIEITARRPETAPEKIELVRRKGIWFVFHEGAEYPAKNARIDDFLDLLAARGAYPVRSAADRERIGLSEENASRITVRGGAGLPLLDLLVGNMDISGREVYLRRADSNEIRSGEDRLSAYIFSGRTGWYDLAFIPEADAKSPEVQRITIYPPMPDDRPGEPRVFAREEGGWIISGVKDPDRSAAENYVRIVLGSGGEDFIGGEIEIAFDSGKLIVELGTGRIYTIRFGPSGESGSRPAQVIVSGNLVSGIGENSDSRYVYLVSEWTLKRLFEINQNPLSE